MQARIQRWGNSLALRIPKAFALTAGLASDTLVEITIVEGQLVVTPISPTPLTLDQLLAGVTEDNRHDEYATGPQRGLEVW